MCIREPEAFLTLPGAAPAPIPKKNCFVRASSGHSKGTYNNEFIMKPLGLPGSRGAPRRRLLGSLLR